MNSLPRIAVLFKHEEDAAAEELRLQAKQDAKTELDSHLLAFFQKHGLVSKTKNPKTGRQPAVTVPVVHSFMEANELHLDLNADNTQPT